ncbi:MAG TPA: MBL fold metallo-hydrolase, partial [Candidatus Hydrogenedentes bacterium]|nr:MBL fold metallo-hydrolase [Candidatus Hydrogenedentota bacterium]
PLVCHQAELPLLQTLCEQGRMFGVPFSPSPEPDRFVEHGDTVNVGNAQFEVRHAPGHSPGHVVLVGDGVVIAGDVLFAGSIGRTDLPGGSMTQLLNSIRHQLLTLPDETVVYCGHGPATTIGEERVSNPFLVS